MNVTLNQNSWHFKLYSKVAGNNPPKTLCPYFWSLVAIIVLSPMLLTIYVIGSGIEFFNNIKENERIKKEMEDTRTYEEVMAEYRKKWDEQDRKERESHARWSKITDVVTWISKRILFPILCVGVIYGIYNAGSKMGWGQFFIAIGMCSLIIGFIIFWIWVIEKYGNRIAGPIGRGLSKLNPFKWGITQIIGGMIYSAYTKACPIINWEGEIKNKEENVYN